jgi:hypothetical protein
MLDLLGAATTRLSPKETIRQESERTWYLDLLFRDTRQTRRIGIEARRPS